MILDKTEIMLGEHLLVPDLAGWRRERFPGLPEENWVSVSPDWICEILSPSTIRLDKKQKMPIYSHYQIPYLWLVDPLVKTLEVFQLESDKWVLLATFAENDRVRAAPFHEVEIDIGNLWWEQE